MAQVPWRTGKVMPSRLSDFREIRRSNLNRNCDRPHPLFRSKERNVGRL